MPVITNNKWMTLPLVKPFSKNIVTKLDKNFNMHLCELSKQRNRIFRRLL